MQKQELHVMDILHNSERMYRKVVIGGMKEMEGRNMSRQKRGKHESAGMSF